MHIHNLHKWTHSHRFHIEDGHGERATKQVVFLTVAMMVIEIGAGFMYGSMALLADGWHMGTHAAALGITLFAYRYARKHADNPRFCFGTGKVNALGGFASAVVLAVVALLMGMESVDRFITPVPIRFNEAIGVAVAGLAVNLFSAFLLRGNHPHDHHDHGTAHGHHHDHNLRAAYLHVIADALSSVLAIVALVAGKALGWVWMDPTMGVVGALVILRWSHGLLFDTGRVLLDSRVGEHLVHDIRSAIESDSDNRVADIHVWEVGSSHTAAILSIVTHYPKPPEHYKGLLSGFQELSHVTIEVNEGSGEPCLAPR